MSLYKKIIRASGVGSDATGHAEKLISAPGGFIGISLTLWLSSHYLGLQGAALLGATALTAVVGSAQVHQLGYQFVLTPVLLNVVVMLIAAEAVNWAFPLAPLSGSLQKTA